MINKKELNWELGFTDSLKIMPDEWIKANVPGSVQLDWAAAKGYPDYKYSDNYKKYAWMEDKYWIYRSKFNIEIRHDLKKYYFISKGIDYEFEIYLNDVKILYQEGMFKRIEADITELLKTENLLLVKIFPAPKIHPKPIDRTQASQSCKPAASYGWDWHPRLVPLGIWDETYIEERPLSHIQKADAVYRLSSDLSTAEVDFEISAVNSIGKEYYLKIISPSGDLIQKSGIFKSDKQHISLSMENIMLWYPRGIGEQHLYQYEISLLETGSSVSNYKGRIGFRSVKLNMNSGAWDEPSTFPKTRSVPPIQVEINGINIFCKGSNWVMPEIFYGTIDDDRYRELIDLAVEANFNILKIWGGSIVNKDFFYEYCDERGIMIWQDFPLSCNNYFGSEKYLSTLENEARSIILRLRKHPCLTIWCGGNELFNSWSGMTDQSLALRLLNKLTYELDRSVPFIPTAPLMGMAHGHYLFYDNKTDKDVFEIYPNAHFTALTEFGVSSTSFLELLKTIIPENELWPPSEASSWKEHHAFKAWDEAEGSWLNLEIIERYFGKQENLAQMIDNSQILQAVGLNFIFEEARRHKPYCSMAMNWCFNDCWPAASNTSIICYPNKPKEAFFSVKNACRPVLASARVKKILWNTGELFEADLFILNDSMQGISEGILSVNLLIDDTKLNITEWDYPSADPLKNITGPKVSFEIPEIVNPQFYLLIEDRKNPEYNSKYLLLKNYE